MSVASVANDRQQRLIKVADAARARALQSWRQMDFANLDQSWSAVSPTIVQTVTAAQFTMASSSDQYTSRIASAENFDPTPSSGIPESFAGVDGQGRALDGILFGAVTTTKKAVGAGFGSVQSLEAGASYLAVIMKTLIADISRSADLTSSAGKGFTHYIRMCNGSACSRCAILAGISSGSEAFKRHASCQCCAVPTSINTAWKGLHTSPESVFHAMSPEEQDRAFTKDGAEAIRSGADVTKVVNARRGADGIGYSSHGGSPTLGAPRGRFVKTTIGYRPNGDPVQVYTTGEGRTIHGEFGKTQARSAEARIAAGSRYRSTGRIRLMPESIIEIAGNDLPLRQAFLRDAGYLDYVPYRGPVAEAQRRADRIAVDRATLRFKNFTLG